MPTLAFTTRPPANPLRELPTHSLHFPSQIFFLRTTPELKLKENESQGLRVEKKPDNLTPVGTTKKLIRGGERESVNGEDWRLFKLSCRDSAAATLPTAASGPGIAQQIPTCLLLLCSHKQLRKGAWFGGLTGKQALQSNEPGEEGFPLWVSAFLSWDLFCPYFFSWRYTPYLPRYSFALSFCVVYLAVSSGPRPCLPRCTASFHSNTILFRTAHFTKVTQITCS